MWALVMTGLCDTVLSNDVCSLLGLRMASGKFSDITLLPEAWLNAPCPVLAQCFGSEAFKCCHFTCCFACMPALLSGAAVLHLACRFTSPDSLHHEPLSSIPAPCTKLQLGCLEDKTLCCIKRIPCLYAFVHLQDQEISTLV